MSLDHNSAFPVGLGKLFENCSLFLELSQFFIISHLIQIQHIQNLMNSKGEETFSFTMPFKKTQHSN